MTHPPKVSVVVPAYNAETTIGPLLDSLLRVDYPDFEVIVINDGSRDGTHDVVVRYPVRLVNQWNKGASAARDAGLRLASGEIVAYVDSDVTVTPDWLRNLVKPFADPSIAATTGHMIVMKNETCASWMRSLDIERRYSRRKTFTRVAHGPNCAFRRSILLEVGGFDPAWYHAEDTEVSYRIWQKGYRIRYVPEAIVYHVADENWRTFLRKRYRDSKAFTRMLARYTRSAMLEDDFVSLGMKVQPPVFLATLFLAIIAFALLLTPLGMLGLIALATGLLITLLLIIPEALAVARGSRRANFFFKGIGLGFARGFAWGIGLGVGGVGQVVRR